MPTGKQPLRGGLIQFARVPQDIELATLENLRLPNKPALDPADRKRLSDELYRYFSIYLALAVQPRPADKKHDPVTFTEVKDNLKLLQRTAKAYHQLHRRLPTGTLSDQSREQLEYRREKLLIAIETIISRLAVFATISRAMVVNGRGKQRSNVKSLPDLQTCLDQEALQTENNGLPDCMHNTLEAIVAIRLKPAKWGSTDPHLENLIISLLPIWRQVTLRSPGYTNGWGIDGQKHMFADWLIKMLKLCYKLYPHTDVSMPLRDQIAGVVSRIKNEKALKSPWRNIG